MTLDAHTLRAIAVAASCDPRTVRRFVEGKPVRPMVAERIRKAMRDPERFLKSTRERGRSDDYQ